MGEQKSITFFVFSSTELFLHVVKSKYTSIKPALHCLLSDLSLKHLPFLLCLNCFLFIYLETFAVKCCSFGFLLCCELFFPPFQTVLLFFGIQFCFQNCLAFFFFFSEQHKTAYQFRNYGYANFPRVQTKMGRKKWR